VSRRCVSLLCRRMLSGLLVAALLLQYAAADTLGGYSATFVTSLRQRLSLKHKIGQMVQLNLAVLLNHDQLTLNSTTCAPSPHPSSNDYALRNTHEFHASGLRPAFGSVRGGGRLMDARQIQPIAPRRQCEPGQVRRRWLHARPLCAVLRAHRRARAWERLGLIRHHMGGGGWHDRGKTTGPTGPKVLYECGGEPYACWCRLAPSHVTRTYAPESGWCGWCSQGGGGCTRVEPRLTAQQPV
jgi:hypothetical protein